MLPTKDWPHAPVHRMGPDGIYIVTAGTYYKQLLFKGDEKLTLLETTLLSMALKYDWQLEAWAVFANHYHFIARSSQKRDSLRALLINLHANTARDLNRLDGTAERKVWFNFWDTKLTFERSYLARLSYVHRNPVKHGLVLVANQYPWCSASWFERTVSPAFVKTIYGFKIDKINIHDDF